jgi:hypothetical protein
MTKQFCDRCGGDVTNRPSDGLHVIENADVHGNGTVTAAVDLCKPCTRALRVWLAGRRGIIVKKGRRP